MSQISLQQQFYMQYFVAKCSLGLDNNITALECLIAENHLHYIC